MKKVVLMVVIIFLCTMFGEVVQSQQAVKKNPYEGNQKAIKEGSEIFKKKCEGCHGVGGRGDICPSLIDKEWRYGNSDADLFLTISKGRPGGMPNWENMLGADRIWKVIAYIRSIAQK